MAYEIINKFIQASKYPIKAPYAMDPQYITFHNTANDATALGEVSYMTNNSNQTSYHVAIDDKHAVQAIPFSRSAWHAGDGQGAGNRKSIGIEVCYSKSGGPKYAAAEENAIEYIAHILKDKGWGIDRVKWHRDWSGKNCPHRVLDEGRATSVRNRIVAKLAELKGQVVPAINPKPSEEVRDYFMKGDKLPGVKVLQQNLSKLGFSISVDGIYGNGTEKAVRAFQLQNGLIVDGIAGKATLSLVSARVAKLNKPAPKPVVKPKEEIKAEKTNEPSAWAKEAVEAAVEMKISDGKNLKGNMTREEGITIIMRALGHAPKVK